MNTRQPDHLNLLCDLGELTSIVTGESDIETFLARTAGLVATHLKAHVCSIYLHSSDTGDLVLKATRGLNPDAVNQVKMKPGEGLVGLCFSENRILRKGNARKTPGFKFFSNAGEESFNSFLCVPLCQGVEKVGVLVVQHREIDHFTPFDQRALKTAATQLAGAVENARLLMTLAPDKDAPPPPPDLPAFIRGQANATGVAQGLVRPSSRNRKALVFEEDRSGRSYTLTEFTAALEKTVSELKALQDKFSATLPESASLIFTAHFMMLKDKNFTGKMENRICSGENAVAVIQDIAKTYIRIFAASPHVYMQEKAVDVEDLSIRLLANLTDARAGGSGGKGTIAVAKDLYPSDILKLVADGVRGIVLVGGGITSHVTILTRSLGLPLIITDDTRIVDLPPDTRLLLDGSQGNIFINPDEKTLALFATRARAETQAQGHPMSKTTLTLDGQRVRLLANINLLSEIRLATDLKAEGVGLYRTEFPFLIRSGFPSEDEQFLIYKRLIDQTASMAVTTIRTLDAGGEKTLSYAGAAKEANPVLGLRSIRFALKYREVFEAQIRAILRAAAGNRSIRLMFPLISSVDEFLEAKKVVTACARELEAEKIAHAPGIDIGMMIELPSVLPLIDEFADLADFFAVGTNDFVQYMIGADRANKLVADIYLPHHPAVNRGLKTISDAGKTHGIDVSVCGEMAHDPRYIPFLLGIGIQTLSVDPQFLALVQETVMGIRMDEAEGYAQRIIKETRITGVEKVMDTRPGIRKK